MLCDLANWGVEDLECHCKVFERQHPLYLTDSLSAEVCARCQHEGKCCQHEGKCCRHEGTCCHMKVGVAHGLYRSYGILTLLPSYLSFLCSADFIWTEEAQEEGHDPATKERSRPTRSTKHPSSRKSCPVDCKDSEEKDWVENAVAVQVSSATTGVEEMEDAW